MMIGKKNARTSVLRNAVKRRIREQFRLRQAVLPDMQYVVRFSTAITVAYTHLDVYKSQVLPSHK